ncbi:Plasmodium exported protein, unknown function [Plasmodium berghei]|uniref:Uncharacterized protein n=2 Tax=Plasmodium berghei TaxID=5821 RepID=A0A509B269_PLABA|nr:Plasmodium exported protein, unknown function [Plasmodium berghei ANKA]SBW38146.1 Plasmodium exported protein, unknown function [Plasmodium berghei]SCL81967.1 Plasmodium exported protein, unknown function [Plasmodium berghei]SCL84544.1 Plasmodium exported protein, unknown function [Plasmodium berghei]SCL85985.1 Plasmodium exported protein, unknown function [Plasmodium berghei]VUC58714.1 Plasmodium exported protein, unknown function [Plasmodium berghei ANKA]|eukprot:XP_034424477.1 Plasmodium exported protein, unknown function [Plasmodium berghei ANKA]
MTNIHTIVTLLYKRIYVHANFACIDYLKYLLIHHKIMYIINYYGKHISNINITVALSLKRHLIFKIFQLSFLTIKIFKMNTKLYSLFVFIYLIIVYCATVHGNKNDNGKNNGNGLSFIKKIYQNDNNKDNKHVQRTGEDGIGTFDIKYLYKCFCYVYIQVIQNCVNTKVCIQCKCLHNIIYLFHSPLILFYYMKVFKWFLIYFLLIIILCIINNFCFINPSGDVIVDILKKEYVDPHIIKLVDIVNKKENKLKKINERKHIYQLLAMSLGALFISRLIYDIKGQYMSSIENPNSMINKLKNKLTTKKTKL